MIIYKGQLLENDQLNRVMEELEEWSLEAIAKREHIAQQVIAACDKLSGYIAQGKYQEIIKPLLEQGLFSDDQLQEATQFFSEENLRYRYDLELGILEDQVVKLNAENPFMKRKILPQGVLFHIAAGNAQGLPFFSVIEGMLTGNINILKLPSADNGISVLLMYELIRIEPKLADYICVLDVPSTDVIAMKKLAGFADAVVVWGGDEAIKAVRMFADPSTQIISWGHKLSFSYVSNRCLEKFLQEIKDGKTPKLLTELADHICSTKQVLCSSCQGIFAETTDEGLLKEFGQAFVYILEKESHKYPENSIGVRGKISLKQYNDRMEKWGKSDAELNETIKRGGVSVTVSMKQELTLSDMFCNCYVRPLPKDRIISVLKGQRGYLQTVGLMCMDEEWEEYTDKFMRAGATRICQPGDMSKTEIGGTHDGEYPLRRYTRVAESCLGS